MTSDQELTTRANHPLPKYQRVLLKLSGEALMGELPYGIAPQVISRIVSEINQLVQLNIQLALVIGGGNIFRGVGLTSRGIDRVVADQMGMLATVMNALAMQDALQKNAIPTRVMSAIQMETVCEIYARQTAIRHLEKGRVVIFTAGTGHPFFTTDTAASLRAIEINAGLMIKATKVDGVYTANPVNDPSAERFSQISYNEVLARQLEVMDMTAVILCRDHKLPLRVLDMGKTGALQRAIMGENEGTLIYHEELEK